MPHDAELLGPHLAAALISAQLHVLFYLHMFISRSSASCEKSQWVSEWHRTGLIFYNNMTALWKTPKDPGDIF